MIRDEIAAALSDQLSRKVAENVELRAALRRAEDRCRELEQALCDVQTRTVPAQRDGEEVA